MFKFLYQPYITVFIVQFSKTFYFVPKIQIYSHMHEYGVRDLILMIAIETTRNGCTNLQIISLKKEFSFTDPILKF